MYVQRHDRVERRDSLRTQLIFREPDLDALARGWEVHRPTPFRRVYRDPRWDSIVACTDCQGTGLRRGARVPRLRRAGHAAARGSRHGGRPMTTPFPSGDPSPDEVFRRLTPPPGRARWPGLLTVLVRWRAELLLAGAVAALWHWFGGLVVGLVGLAVAVLGAAVPPVRHGLICLLQTVVVPHRVRAGLVQAGVGDRTGRPPWLPWARPIGTKGMVVGVWLRAGTTPATCAPPPRSSPRRAGPRPSRWSTSGRDDRAELHVVRPRWGWPGR